MKTRLRKLDLLFKHAEFKHPEQIRIITGNVPKLCSYTPTGQCHYTTTIYRSADKRTCRIHFPKHRALTWSSENLTANTTTSLVLQ
jgi:hypothetical protein